MLQFKWHLFFLAFLFNQSCNQAKVLPVKRIVNGFHAEAKQFPYQVFIQTLNKRGWVPHCGGVIISSRIVVTAAHCIDNEMDAYKLFFGALDVSNEMEVGQERLIVKKKNIVVHPKYDEYQIINDIALIRLPADLEFNDFIQPAKLPDPDQLYVNENGVVSGWGSVSGVESAPSNQLLYYNVTVLSNEECRTIMSKKILGWFFPSSYICLNRSQSAACYGDSGGPLAIRNENGSSTLLGITSFGLMGCPVNTPIIYTRISSFLQWIKQYE